MWSSKWPNELFWMRPSKWLNGLFWMRYSKWLNIIIIYFLNLALKMTQWSICLFFFLNFLKGIDLNGTCGYESSDQDTLSSLEEGTYLGVLMEKLYHIGWLTIWVVTSELFVLASRMQEIMIFIFQNFDEWSDQVLKDFQIGVMSYMFNPKMNWVSFAYAVRKKFSLWQRFEMDLGI